MSLISILGEGSIQKIQQEFMQKLHALKYHITIFFILTSTKAIGKQSFCKHSQSTFKRNGHPISYGYERQKFSSKKITLDQYVEGTTAHIICNSG